jgi:methylated-DNA-[protein]-cysteine S-methyltransferase
MSETGTVATPWGYLGCELGDGKLRRVTLYAPAGQPLTGPWATAFAEYVDGNPIPESLPLDLAALSPFTQRVLLACRTIPFGTVMSYTQLAHLLGAPKSARAVGHALARNPLPIAIPCHRVVAANGSLTGYLGGLALKQQLLLHEGVQTTTEVPNSARLSLQPTLFTMR